MAIQEREERDNYIVQDYKAGSDPKSIARAYGLTDRRVMQILKEAGVEFRPRKKRFEMDPISKMHERIGRSLADHRFEKEIDQKEAADQLGWSFHKLRKTEEGISELELLDLMDIASYTGKNIEEIIRFAKS